MFLRKQTDDEITALIERNRGDDAVLTDLLNRLIQEDIHHERIRQLLDESVVWDGALLTLACRDGKTELVLILLADQRDTIITSDCMTSSLENAAGAGHLAIVCRLLVDSRLDPQKQQYSWFEAILNDRLEVLEALLSHRALDPNVEQGNALLCAADDLHVGALRLLVQDERVDLRINKDRALKHAAKEGEEEALMILVKAILVREPDADHSLLWRRTMKHAAKHDRTAILQWLLEKSGITPENLQWPLLTIAVDNRATDVVRFLLRDYGYIMDESVGCYFVRQLLMLRADETLGVFLESGRVRASRELIRLALDNNQRQATAWLSKRWAEDDDDDDQKTTKRRKVDINDV